MTAPGERLNYQPSRDAKASSTNPDPDQPSRY